MNRLVVCRTAGDALTTFSDYWSAHEELCHLPFSLCLRMVALAPSTPCLVMAVVEDGGPCPTAVSASLLHSDPTKPIFLQAPGAPRESVFALLDAWQGEWEYSSGCSGVVAEPAVSSLFMDFVAARRRRWEGATPSPHSSGVGGPSTATDATGSEGKSGTGPGVGPEAVPAVPPAVHRLFQEFLVQRVAVLPARPAPGACVLADSSHEALLTAWCTAFHVETFRHVPPMVAHAAVVGPANAAGLLVRRAAYLWVLGDGTPVSLVAVNGLSPTLVGVCVCEREGCV